MRRWRIVSLLLLAVLSACGDGPVDPGEEGVPESELTFVEFSAEMLPLVVREASFWAVKGEDRELVLRYQPEEPGSEGEEFLEFEVSGNSLLQWPDGRAFARGDSVLITVKVNDAARFLFTFEPAGLVFDPDHPAELEVTYLRANKDLNGDGVVNGGDEDLERRLGLWRQQRAGERWFKQATLRFEDLDEVEARIFHFSRFALAG